jgi:hypothetical protein
MSGRIGECSLDPFRWNEHICGEQRSDPDSGHDECLGGQSLQGTLASAETMTAFSIWHSLRAFTRSDGWHITNADQ